MKKLMVVIPVHNGEGLIEQTLDSLLAQTLDGFDIAIVDNKSDDSTVRICIEYLNKIHTKLCERNINTAVIINEKNIGRIGNWNKALDVFRESDCEACKIMFVGDTLEPDCLGIQLLYVSADIAPVISCAHRVTKEDGTSYIMNHIKDEDDMIMKYFPKEALEKSIKDGNWFAGTTACVMFSKEALGNRKFTEGLNWAGDWKFWAEMCAYNKIVYTSEVLANFNMGARKGYKRMAGTELAAKEEATVKKYIKHTLLDE
jgi:glycosyltransferase involved in cell wall biosynthesis